MRVPGKSIGVWGLILACSMAVAEPDANRVRERAGEWERAALNREWAAVTQQNEALSQLAMVKQLREVSPSTDAERRKLLTRAGDAAMRAGDLEAAAFANYDRAVANWGTVAGQYGSIDDEKSRRDAARMVEQLKLRATAAARRSAEHYELAAELYGDGMAGVPGKSAGASMKAATWREKLAGRG
jgi:hypothetical protein